MPMPFVPGQVGHLQSLTLVCKVCKTPPRAINTCGAVIYYVFGLPEMTHACIHMGVHDHPHGQGICRDFENIIIGLVDE